MCIEYNEKDTFSQYIVASQMIARQSKSFALVEAYFCSSETLL